MRPVAVDRRFAELASPVDHARTLPGDRRPRPRSVPGESSRAFAEQQAVSASLAGLEQKGNKLECLWIISRSRLIQ
jgi:hypothetical protein